MQLLWNVDTDLIKQIVQDRYLTTKPLSLKVSILVVREYVVVIVQSSTNQPTMVTG